MARGDNTASDSIAHYCANPVEGSSAGKKRRHERWLARAGRPV